MRHNTRHQSEALSPWGMTRAAEVRIRPLEAPFQSTVVIPGSKSFTNRALIIAALAGGHSVLQYPLLSDDSYWCVEALRKLGVDMSVNRSEGIIEINGVGDAALHTTGDAASIYLGSAGTIARFLPAVIAARGSGAVKLSSSEQLAHRPMRELIQALRTLGAEIEISHSSRTFPMTIKGGSMRGGEVTISGKRSSQFISALLIAAPLAPHPVTIHISDHIVQSDYVRMTLEMMARFGVEVTHDVALTHFEILPQRYQAQRLQLEADASTATYFLALAAATQSEITIPNLNLNTRQPDIMFIDHLSAMGCEVIRADNTLTLRGPTQLKGHLHFDFNPCSDSTPALASIAPFASGPIEVSGVEHIRAHECDRLKVLADTLNQAGVMTREHRDGLTIQPTLEAPHMFSADPHDDHRMAMAFSVMAIAGRGGLIEDPACVSKTCPQFYAMMRTLGVNYTLY